MTHSARVSLLPLAVAASLLAACVTPASARTDQALTVRELTVVDEQGTPRLRLGAPLPDPKGMKRAVTIVGLQLMDADGKEVGGLVMIDKLGVRGLCFDAAEDYEAMCMGLIQGQPSITFRQDWKDRIVLGVENGVATVTVNDGQGAPKLKLQVDKDGQARVEGVLPATGAR